MESGHSVGHHPVIQLVILVVGFVMEVNDSFAWLMNQHIPPLLMDAIHAGSWAVLGLVSWLTYKRPKKK